MGNIGFVPQSVHPSMECLMYNDVVEAMVKSNSEQ